MKRAKKVVGFALLLSLLAGLFQTGLAMGPYLPENWPMDEFIEWVRSVNPWIIERADGIEPDWNRATVSFSPSSTLCYCPPPEWPPWLPPEWPPRHPWPEPGEDPIEFGILYLGQDQAGLPAGLYALRIVEEGEVEAIDRGGIAHPSGSVQVRDDYLIWSLSTTPPGRSDGGDTLLVPIIFPRDPTIEPDSIKVYFYYPPDE